MQTSAHKHAPWRKAVLIPCWVFQLIFEFWVIVVLGLALGVIISARSDGDGVIYDRTAINIVAPIWIGIGVICLILTITEIVMLARKKLQPKTFVIMNTIKSTLWFGVFVYDIIRINAYANKYTKTYKGVEYTVRPVSWVSIIGEAILLLAFWIPLIYGSIIYHRTRKIRRAYKSVYMENEYDLPIDTSYPPGTYGAEAYHEDPDVEMATIASNDGPGRNQRGNYNHNIDTRFEDYAQNRHTLKGPVVRVDGVEETELGSRRNLD